MLNIITITHWGIESEEKKNVFSISTNRFQFRSQYEYVDRLTFSTWIKKSCSLSHVGVHLFWFLGRLANGMGETRKGRNIDFNLLKNTHKKCQKSLKIYCRFDNFASQLQALIVFILCGLLLCLCLCVSNLKSIVNSDVSLSVITHWRETERLWILYCFFFLNEIMLWQFGRVVHGL